MIEVSDIANKFLAAYNSHDPARVSELLSEGGTQENVAPGLKHMTSQEVQAALAPFFEAVPDAQWNETQRIVAGDSVVIAYSLTGHLLNDIGPFKARGQRIDHVGVHVLKIKDGQIISAQDFWDPVEFARKVNAD